MASWIASTLYIWMAGEDFKVRETSCHYSYLSLKDGSCPILSLADMHPIRSGCLHEVRFPGVEVNAVQLERDKQNHSPWPLSRTAMQAESVYCCRWRFIVWYTTSVQFKNDLSPSSSRDEVDHCSSEKSLSRHIMLNSTSALGSFGGDHVDWMTTKGDSDWRWVNMVIYNSTSFDKWWQGNVIWWQLRSTYCEWKLQIAYVHRLPELTRREALSYSAAERHYIQTILNDTMGILISW